MKYPPQRCVWAGPTRFSCICIAPASCRLKSAHVIYLFCHICSVNRDLINTLHICQIPRFVEPVGALSRPAQLRYTLTPMSFARAIATVGGLTILSRVAGFARDILTAAVLGAGPVADAFFVALKLPNFFRRLFAEGAFSVSFVPMFSAELQKNGRQAAQSFAEEVMAIMLTVLLPFVIVMVAAMPWLMHALAPGFVGEPGKFALA